MRVGAYATNDPVYGAYADRLESRLEEIGANHRIVRVDPWSADFRTQSCHKSTIIKEVLSESDEPLLWMDVDGLLHKVPEISEKGDCAFARNIMGNIWVANQVHLWFNTPKAHALLDWWIDSCKSREIGSPSDHIRLKWAIDEVETDWFDLTPYLDGCLTIYSTQTDRTRHY